MADVERSLISKVVYSGDLPAVLKAGVNGLCFHDEQHGPVWDWVVDHFNRYGKAPGREALRHTYPTWQLAKVPEPLDYYIEALLKHHRRYETIDLTQDILQRVKDEEIDSALSLMSNGALEITKATTHTDDEDVRANWEERMDRWEELRDRSGELIGIPTGFRFIDKATGGLQPEQFVVLIGPQKAGKSSIALSIAMSASDAGYSTVFIGFEMANREQEARHDAMRGGFNPNKLLWGTATDKELDRLERELKRTQNKAPLHLVHDMGARSLSTAIAKVAQYKPDLVIVDGVYMMDAEIPGIEGIDTLALTKISRSLKVLAQTRKIPVFVTHQALEAKYSKKTGLVASASGYTSAFGQDCDVMLGIEPADDENVAKLRIITGRNVGARVGAVKFDWDNGCIEEIDEPTWTGGDDDAETDDDGDS